jgi:hypothetical protein
VQRKDTGKIGVHRWGPLLNDYLCGIPISSACSPHGDGLTVLFDRRRIFRIICGILIAMVVVLVWQAYRDEQTRKLIKAWTHSSVTWLSSGRGATERGSGLRAEPSTILSDKPTSMPAATSANEVPDLRQQLQSVVNDLTVLHGNVEKLSSKLDQVADLQQQLQSVVNDLTVLHRNVEALSSKQEQMSRDIAAVQATEQAVSDKIRSLTQAAPVRAPQRKNVSKPVPAESGKPPAAASLTQQTSPAGTGSVTDQPPRPPLPVPSPAETASQVQPVKVTCQSEGWRYE